MHIVSLAARYFLCLIPYIILFSNKDIIYHITGPITIPPFRQEKQSLIYIIGVIEFFRVFYESLMKLFILLFSKLGLIARQQPHTTIAWINSMTIKYGFVMLIKLFVIFYEIHRLKYYLHVFFIELFMVAVNVLADVVNNRKVSLVMDIVLVDSLNRVALFYQLTRTFNPNFGLYFFGNNLLTLICYMLEGDKKQVLYVKHDIYRIMIVTFAYLFLFSLLQSSVTYRPLLIFFLTGYFFLKAIQSFSNNSSAQMKNESSEKQKPKIRFSEQVTNNLTKLRRINYNSQNTQQSLRSYIQKMQHNYGFLYFIILITITMGVELIFILKDSTNTAKSPQIVQQTVRNSFMQFYMTMKQNPIQ